MAVGRPFQKGQSGNPSGRPKRRLFDETLKQAIQCKHGARAKQLTEKLLQIALEGDVQALRLIAERIGGKPRTAEQVEQQTEPASTREQTRAKLIELLRSPELRGLIEESLKPGDTVQ